MSVSGLSLVVSLAWGSRQEKSPPPNSVSSSKIANQERSLILREVHDHAVTLAQVEYRVQRMFHAGYKF